MVVELIADYTLGPLERLHQCNAALVVHHVERPPLQRRIARAVEFAIDFCYTDIEPLFDLHAGRRLRDLADALAAGSVNVIGPPALLERAIRVVRIDRLAARHLQAVLEIPRERLQLRHGGHIAVGVVLVIFDPRYATADIGGSQAVAHLARFQKAGFLVRIRAGPAGIGGVVARMYELKEIARIVILVLFRVSSQRVAVPWMRQLDTWNIVVIRGPGPGRRTAVEPEMLAPVRLNQAVNSIVGVVGGWLYLAIGEVHGLLSRILNVRDVSRRIIGIREILRRLLARRKAGARRVQGGETQGERIVAVCG